MSPAATADERAPLKILEPISFTVAGPGRLATHSRRSARHCDLDACCHDVTVTVHPASLHVRRQRQRRVRCREMPSDTPPHNDDAPGQPRERASSYRHNVSCDVIWSVARARGGRPRRWPLRCLHASSDRHGVTIWPSADKPLLTFLNETNARSGARRAVADGERTHVSTREMDG
jgi:hypothetical protein